MFCVLGVSWLVSFSVCVLKIVVSSFVCCVLCVIDMLCMNVLWLGDVFGCIVWLRIV